MRKTFIIKNVTDLKTISLNGHFSSIIMSAKSCHYHFLDETYQLDVPTFHLVHLLIYPGNMDAVDFIHWFEGMARMLSESNVSVFLSFLICRLNESVLIFIFSMDRISP